MFEPKLVATCNTTRGPPKEEQGTLRKRPPSPLISPQIDTPPMHHDSVSSSQSTDADILFSPQGEKFMRRGIR